MLVLQRKVGEAIQIGDGVTVTVVRTAAGRITLGITAPPDCPIRRREAAPEPTPATTCGPTP